MPANWLHDEIARRGPIPVADFMALALTHPQHGYYCRRDAFGRTGDFVTAPEISQVFGELIGIWCLATWESMGRPQRWRLVEFGPGRGTLMRDALRALRLIADCRDSVSVDLVEISPLLAEIQRATLANDMASNDMASIAWSARFEPAPLPTIIIANEFLDALPVTQWVRRADGWHLRLVAGLANGSLAFTEQNMAIAPPGLPMATADEGAIFERRDGFEALCSLIAQSSTLAPIAGLFIDYGHYASGYGDTLQAVRQHAYVSPLMEPGMADLSAQVDFAAFVATARNSGLVATEVLPQAEFLGRLGIIERAQSLLARADARQRAGIETDIARLISPDAMGSLFKVVCLAAKGLTLPVFSTTA